KNKDFHATPDSLATGAKFQDRWSWKRDVQQEWVDQITDDYPQLMEAIESARYAHSDGMGAFMCFMAVRLMEMRRVLKPSGSIYVHCDPTASHYLKACMDAIFGWRNFRNEIVWHYRRWTAPSGDLQRLHDILLWYCKDNPKRIYNTIWVAPANVEKGRNESYEADDSGRLFRWQSNKGKRYKIYRDERGVHAGDVWDISFLHPSAKERVGFPTQKPLALYERMIRASSNEGDMILDPFAGCATTCVAAERLGRQWAGIDIWENAKAVVLDRMAKERLALPEAERGDLFTADIVFTDKPPGRTDGGETAAPFLRVTERRAVPLAPWQKLSRAQIVQELAEAQTVTEGLVLCAGCGRELEPPFMELDHITPRSDRGENDISNRILLCRPCNGRKSARLTMKGLLYANRKAGWLKDRKLAEHARDLAHERYEEVRYRRQWPAVTGDLFG
ncbi:MAG: hypothetical protein F4178_13655, partial [Rhodospirillaceae bacterium]|nr:hypothetical protein [Rhodospirillaceae bacterium]